MARSQRPAKSTKTRAPSRQANALGYAKRQSRKPKSPVGTISDVYDYQPERTRRSKVKLDLGRDELIGGGSGDEDEEGVPARRAAQPRLVGEAEDDEHIGEDEDEELDSDEAFEESDEERFAGFDFSHKSKPKSRANTQKKQAARRTSGVRFAEVDLNEDGDDEDAEHGESSADSGSDIDKEEEEEEEEGDPDDFIDVLDIMDGKGEAANDEEDANKQVQKPKQRGVKVERSRLDQASGDEDEDMDGLDDAEGSGSEVSEEESDHDNLGSDIEEDAEDDSALQDLERFVTNLDAGQKRKAPDDDAKAEDAMPARKRRLLKERTEAGAENEFAAHVGGGKLQLDDLLAPLASQTSNLLSLKKSAKVLASQSGSSKTLAAPLPQRTAERLDREAAYEQTKEEVDKWKATMQRIREAEHLSFPLQAKPSGKVSNLELAAKFKPTTELENAVDRLLKSAKMREEDITQTETLKMNHLSVEEVAARRGELAKMRALMFRAEAKAKRVAKIKSKTYRRIKKKERARLAEKLGEGDDVDEDDEETRMKREMERARERATLRHKNTGKWAKAMRSRGELDEDQRRDIHEMLDRGEKLRRKIRGEASGSENESDEDSGAEEGEEGIRRIKEHAFEELAGLAHGESATEVEVGEKSKGIFEMKFMKDAMAREARKADEMANDFIKEMGGQFGDEDALDANDEAQSYGAAVDRVGGRVTYRPGPDIMSGALRPLGSLASDTSSVTLKSSDLLEPPRESPPLEQVAPDPRVTPAQGDEINPWLSLRVGQSTSAQKKHEVVVSKNSTAIEKSKNKLSKRAKQREEEKAKAHDDATVDISMSDVLTLTSGSAAAGPSRSAATSLNSSSYPPHTSTGDDDDDPDANSEVEAQETALLSRKGKKKASGVQAFEQRELVALAFAGDKVVQDFEEQKRRETQEDAPQEIDTTLAGWGSWGGAGTRKAPPKPYLIKKIAGVDPTSRADYNKAHVIISEKRDKKAAKYLVKDLPYPYTSKAQFERSLDTPIGTEWNTRVGFQRATLPKVIKKMGTVITPLEKQL